MFDRDALNALFDYTEFTWGAYGRAIGSLPADVIARPIEGSGWPALRNVLFHIAGGWDGWMAETLRLDAPEEVDVSTISTWEQLDGYRRKVRGWLRRIIDETAHGELKAQTRPMWQGTAAEMQTSISDIIAHILLHERGHHGDVTTLLSQLGATPPPVDYLVYRFFKQRQRR